jgi:hypothetical protein
VQVFRCVTRHGYLLLARDVAMCITAVLTEELIVRLTLPSAGGMS